MRPHILLRQAQLLIDPKNIMDQDL